MKFNVKKTISIIFIIFIFVPFILILKTIYNNYPTYIEIIKFNNYVEIPTKIEQTINNQFAKPIVIDVFGLIQKALRKNEVKNFEVLKSADGQLYLGNYIRNTKIEETVNSIVRINEYVEGKADFLFVQAPFKNTENVESLIGYDNSKMNTEFNEILAELNNFNIPTLDLRNDYRTQQYYSTDHHWTTEASFYATINIIEYIEKNYEIDLDKDYRKIENYTREIYENSFLGSIGIKVGEYYLENGRDDFELLIPKFETNLKYTHYDRNGFDMEKEGDFREAFIDVSKLNDIYYNNKYESNLYGGFVENIIENRTVDNNLKVLLISHSYGRNMTQYLSLFFKETRYLDPQDGRFTSNYLEYISFYNPDIVIVMYDSVINVEN